MGKVHVKCPDCGGTGGWKNSSGEMIQECKRCNGTGGIFVDEKDADKY